MKVKTVLLFSYFGFKSGGGTATCTATIATLLHRRGYRVIVASSEPLKGKWQWQRIFPLRFIPNLFWRDKILTWQLRHLLKKYQVDLCHICDCRFGARAGILATKSLNIKIVVDLRDFWFCSLNGLLTNADLSQPLSPGEIVHSWQHPPRSLARWLWWYYWHHHKISYYQARYQLFKSVDYFLPVSAVVADIWQQYFPLLVPWQLMGQSVIAFSANIAEKSLCRQQLIKRHHLSGEKIIFFAGRLVAHRGLSLIVKLAKQLKKQSVVILLAGSGEGRQWLQQQIKKNHLTKLILCGQLNEATLKTYLWGSDIFIFPTGFIEPFGSIVLEAMEAKTAVVANALGNLKNLIKNNYSGYLADPANDQDFLIKVKKLLADERLRALFAKQAAKQAKHYNNKDFIARLERIYSKV